MVKLLMWKRVKYVEYDLSGNYYESEMTLYKNLKNHIRVTLIQKIKKYLKIYLEYFRNVFNYFM